MLDEHLHPSVAFLVLLPALCLLQANQSSPDVGEIITLYAEAVSWDSHVSLRVKAQTSVAASQPDRVNVGSRKLDLMHRRDNDRTEWFGTDLLLDNDGKMLERGSINFSRIMNEEFFLVADKHHDADTYFAFVKRDFNQEQASLGCFPPHGHFLEGRVGAVGPRKTMAKKLAESGTARLVRTEEIDGTMCYVVEAKAADGAFTAWIAPDKGYNALKYTITKTGTDLLNGRPMDQTQISNWTIVVDSIALTKVGERYLPVAGHYTHRTLFKDGLEKTTAVQVKRSEIDLNPDFEALRAFTFNLPDGTLVGDSDFPAIRYQTFAGKLRPAVDSYAIDVINKQIEKVRVAGNNMPSESIASDRPQDVNEKTLVNSNQTDRTQFQDSPPPRFSILYSGAFILVCIAIAGAALYLFVLRHGH